MAYEMGKPWAGPQGDLQMCASCRWFADSAGSYLSTDHISTEYQRSYVQFEPLGCIQPLCLEFSFLASSSMCCAGNNGGKWDHFETSLQVPKAAQK